MGQTFEESGLGFSFKESWLVRQYDRHTYFRGLSGAGLKGVDFIAIWQERQLFLIEVKNYRYDALGQRKYHIDARLAHPGQIAHQLVEKLHDTKRALNAIVRYFQKGILYRTLRPILPYLRRIAPEWHFWTLADTLANLEITYVCWLELEAMHQPLAHQIETAARALLTDQSVRLYVQTTPENTLIPDMEYYILHA